MLNKTYFFLSSNIYLSLFLLLFIHLLQSFLEAVTPWSVGLKIRELITNLELVVERKTRIIYRRPLFIHMPSKISLGEII